VKDTGIQNNNYQTILKIKKSSKTQKNNKCGEQGTLMLVDGNANWCGYSGKEYGDSSES